MTIGRVCNPQSFCREAHKLNIRYELLMEARLCIGDQSLARLFKGSSMRGGGGSISSGTITNWLLTFEYIQRNPEHVDDEQYVVHRLEPKDDYYKYIAILLAPISEDVIKSWDSLSNKKLGDEAEKYGITIGIRNSIAIKTLHQRMKQMVERRTTNIWNKTYDIVEDGKVDYRLTNVPELRRICKEKNIKNAHIKSKEELVKLLEETELNPLYTDVKKDYNDKTSKELKSLAKDRGLTHYNNLKKDELVKLHSDYDEDLKLIAKKEDDIENETVDDDTKEGKPQENAEEAIEPVNNAFLKIFTFDGKQIRTAGTCTEPLFVVKDIAEILGLGNYRNVYSKMEDYMKGVQKMDILYKTDNIFFQQEMQVVNESGLYYMIMRSNKPNAKAFQKVVYSDILPSIRKSGSYTLENKYQFILENNRPLSQLLNATDFDREAREIEHAYDWSKNSNCPLIYIAYIGCIKNHGLIKVGFSDSKFDERLSKHISSESQYDQFRLLDTFEVSGKPIEDAMHNLLQVNRYPFKAQKEVYKTTSNIRDFIHTVEKLLGDNDYKLKYSRLLGSYNELERKFLELQLNK
jgi:prophage antirepressor-like protein